MEEQQRKDEKRRLGYKQADQHATLIEEETQREAREVAETAEAAKLEREKQERQEAGNVARAAEEKLKLEEAVRLIVQEKERQESEIAAKAANEKQQLEEKRKQEEKATVSNCSLAKNFVFLPALPTSNGNQTKMVSNQIRKRFFVRQSLREKKG